MPNANAMKPGKDDPVVQGVVVKKGGNFERNIAAFTIDKSAKWKDKNIIVLKVNKALMDKEANGIEEINNIMAMGDTVIEVNGESIAVRPQQHTTGKGKTEIRLERI